jgi:type I restriction enzyme M protein
VSEAKAWEKLDDAEKVAVGASLSALEGTTATDRRVMAGKLGNVPKAIEKAVWDAMSVADPSAPVVTNRKGEPQPDPDLRDNENVPLPSVLIAWDADPTGRLATSEYRMAVDEYMATEVLPFVDDAWVDFEKTRLGYEIPLTRYFYKYVPPRPLADIDAEIKALEAEIQSLLGEVTE